MIQKNKDSVILRENEDLRIESVDTPQITEGEILLGMALKL